MSAGNFTTGSLEGLLNKFPNLLTDAEKQLPEDKRMLLLRAKVQNMLNDTKKPGQNRQAQPRQQQQQQPNQQQQQHQSQQPHPQQSMPNQAQHQQQFQQPPQPPMNAPTPRSQPSQSPRIPIPQQVSTPVPIPNQPNQNQAQPQLHPHAQAQNQAAMQAAAAAAAAQMGIAPGMQQPMTGQGGQMPFPGQMQMSPQQQQQLAAARQMQQQQGYPQQPLTTTAPSPHPSGGPAASSPLTNTNAMMGVSPNSGARPGAVPQGGQPLSFPNASMTAQMKALIENFPKLAERKHQGKLAKDHEKLFDALMSTEVGQQQMSRYQAQQAQNLVQSHLANPVGQQYPQQLQMAAMQRQVAQSPQMNQMAPQQQHPQQMAPQNFNMMPNNNGQPQFTPAQIQQFQLQRQLNQAQAAAQQQQQQQQQQPQNMGRSPQQPNAAHMAALARAQAQAQGQLVHAAQHMGLQGQQQQMMEQAASTNFGSPRPPQMPNIPQDKIQQFKQTLTKLQSMNDQQREAHFQNRPMDRQFWMSAIGMGANMNQMNMAHPDQTQNQNQQNMNMLQNGTPNMAMFAQQQQQQQQQGGNRIQPNWNVAMTNNVPTNLHIPAGKQRNLAAAQQQAQQGTPGSPMQRLSVDMGQGGQNGQVQNNQVQTPQGQQGHGQNHAQIQAQAQAIQNMIKQGIPVNNAQAAAAAVMAATQQQGGPMMRPNANHAGPSSVTGTPGSVHDPTNQGDVRPHMLIQQMKAAQAQGLSGEEARERVRQMSEQHLAAQFDRSNSLLHKVTWSPTPEYDNQLKERISALHRTIRPYGRSTLTQGLGSGRILGDVLVESMPEALTAMAQEAISGVDEEDEEEGKLEIAGLPGQKKRKISELAGSVDKGLEIDGNVESLFLNLADEHIELVANLSCSLAKHRRSDTVDRKDIQLAYEMIGARSIPGFSSDAIRADQARSTKRAQSGPSAARAQKLKAVESAKLAYRKQKAESSKAGSGSGSGLSADGFAAVANGSDGAGKLNGDAILGMTANGDGDQGGTKSGAAGVGGSVTGPASLAMTPSNSTPGTGTGQQTQRMTTPLGNGMSKENVNGVWEHRPVAVVV